MPLCGTLDLANAKGSAGLLALARVRGGSAALASRVGSRVASTHLRAVRSQKGVEAGTRDGLQGQHRSPRLCAVGRQDADLGSVREGL